jgi:hypothetical protein
MLNRLLPSKFPEVDMPTGIPQLARLNLNLQRFGIPCNRDP